ncbi:hypothetical protein L1887_47832 [Cichorium endivia]|nr:hypothetical protein L1887_47832 [Cichorium endivia]
MGTSRKWLRSSPRAAGWFERRLSRLDIHACIALPLGRKDLARALLVDAVGQVNAHGRHVALEHIADRTDKQAVLLLPRLEIRQIRHRRHQHALDVGKNHGARLGRQHGLHRVEEDLDDDLNVAHVRRLGGDQLKDRLLPLALRVRKPGTAARAPRDSTTTAHRCVQLRSRTPRTTRPLARCGSEIEAACSRPPVGRRGSHRDRTTDDPASDARFGTRCRSRRPRPVAAVRTWT